MLAFKGPAQPSPALGEALNAGYAYLEVRCLGCDTSQTVPSTSCGDRRQHRSTSLSATCAARTARRFAAIRTSAAHLVARRTTKITASDPPSMWWIIVRGKLVTRGKAKKADFVLYYKPNIPIAPLGER